MKNSVDPEVWILKPELIWMFLFQKRVYMYNSENKVVWTVCQRCWQTVKPQNDHLNYITNY